MALTAGKNEGYVHFGTITDGLVSFKLLPRDRSVCNAILVDNCSITWAVFIAGDYNLLMLVEIVGPTSSKYFQVVSYDLVSDYLVVLYTIPEFIPDARGLEFLMILGTESYTNFPMVPKGMSYNPYNNLLLIWGNFLLQSFNSENFIYLADFPKELSIKYLVNSFRGDMAIVTENEEVDCPAPLPTSFLPSHKAQGSLFSPTPIRVKGPRRGNILRDPGEWKGSRSSIYS